MLKRNSAAPVWTAWFVNATATISMCTVFASCALSVTSHWHTHDWDEHMQSSWLVGQIPFPVNHTSMGLAWACPNKCTRRHVLAWPHIPYRKYYFVAVLPDTLKRRWLWMVYFDVETDCTKQAVSYKRSGYLTTIIVVLQFGNMGWSTTRI